MDKTIMLWDVSSGNWTRKWRGHQVIVSGSDNDNDINNDNDNDNDLIRRL